MTYSHTQILKNYQKCKCNFEKVEGEDIYECSKCGGLGGYCWRCGENIKKRKNKYFCKECENILKEELRFKEKGGLYDQYS
jgi:RecJ-like exonuclease